MSAFQAIEALLAPRRLTKRRCRLPSSGASYAKELGLSRSQVARAVGVSPSTPSRWEASRP
ncbi:helix-turn-helix domain-containing protein [Streptomyces spiralis]